MTLREARIIVEEFIKNDLKANVVGAGYVEPTKQRFRDFKDARKILGEGRYRIISERETQRFKKAHNL